MTQYHFDPGTYLDLIREDIPSFDDFQERVAEATRGVTADRILELGVGTGETARRVLAIHPAADLVGIDASEEMLEVARRTVGGDLRVARLQDELPAGPFDLVVSALAVHHLDAAEKRDLFRRVATVLRADGLFVVGDVVVPRAVMPRIPLSPEFDLPDTVEDQLAWLRGAGLDATTAFVEADLAIFTARRS